MKASEVGPKLSLYLVEQAERAEQLRRFNAQEQLYLRRWNSCGADHPLMCESERKEKAMTLETFIANTNMEPGNTEIVVETPHCGRFEVVSFRFEDGKIVLVCQ